MLYECSIDSFLLLYNFVLCLPLSLLFGRVDGVLVDDVTHVPHVGLHGFSDLRVRLHERHQGKLELVVLDTSFAVEFVSVSGLFNQHINGGFHVVFFVGTALAFGLHVDNLLHGLVLLLVEVLHSLLFADLNVGNSGVVELLQLSLLGGHHKFASLCVVGKLLMSVLKDLFLDVESLADSLDGLFDDFFLLFEHLLDDLSVVLLVV